MSSIKDKKYAIGIDLGTSNSAAAVYVDGKPIMIVSDGMSVAGKMLPSCVAFLKGGQVVVGATAKNQLLAAPDRVVYQAKRHMGTEKTWTIDDKSYRAQQVAGYILRKIKSDAQKQLGGVVQEVVVTVPAQFNDAQRVSTIDAVRIAGLKLLRIINEPTAAAISYQTDSKSQQIIFVADVGGGTVDTTVLSLHQQVYDILYTGGDTALGGMDIDKLFLQEVVLKKMESLYGKVPISDIAVYERIREATENAKIDLSTLLSTNILLPYLYKSENGQIVSVNFSVDRSELQVAVQPFLAKLKSIILATLQSPEVKGHKVSRLILVGGPTQMPIMKKLIQDTVGVTAVTGVNPNHCVAIGAARQASLLSQDSSGNDAGGAMLLLDVTPLTLGIETQNDVTSVLVPRASKVPTSKTQKYTTASNNQTQVHIKVVQGERYKASDNAQIGQFVLKGIPAMKRGEAVINVTFDIDTNGVVSVSAQEETTKVKQSITIEHSNRLAEAKIQQMIGLAKQNEAADNLYREKVQAVHNAKTLIARIDTLKEEKKQQLSAFEEWSQLEASAKTLTELTASQIQNMDVSRIKEVTESGQRIFGILLQNVAKSSQRNTEVDNASQQTQTPTDSSDDESRSQATGYETQSQVSNSTD